MKGYFIAKNSFLAEVTFKTDSSWGLDFAYVMLGILLLLSTCPSFMLDFDWKKNTTMNADKRESVLFSVS